MSRLAIPHWLLLLAWLAVSVAVGWFSFDLVNRAGALIDFVVGFAGLASAGVGTVGGLVGLWLLFDPPD